jgi:hypothetical protein
MFRVRITQFRDRASYKSSEVIALFIVSIFGGMLFCGLCVVIDFLIGQFLRTRG